MKAFLVSMTLVLASVSVTHVAHAQAPQSKAVEAERLFREALAAEDAHDFGTACQRFQESQDLDPATGTLMNLARCHERSGQLAKAFIEYTQVAVDAQRDGQGQRSHIAAERAKEWDLAHWATILNDVNRRYPYASLVLTGLANARERGELLAALVDGGIHNTVGELTLPRFARLVRHAAAVLTTDSGSVHLASAFGVPVFVLFSQIYNYRQFLPYQVANDFSVVPVSCAGCIYGCAAVTCMKHDVSKVRDQIHRFCQGIPSLSA